MNKREEKKEPENLFSIQLRVYYEDTDFGGVVYYANYLKFMERARTEYLRAAGFDQSVLLAEERVQFVVKSADIKFVSPARFDDVLSVSCEVKKIGRASMEFTQQCRVVRSASSGGEITNGGELVAGADVLIACINADSFRPCALPESMKSLHPVV